MFNIIEGATTEADVGEYMITVSIEDEKGVRSQPDLVIKLKILSFESLVGVTEAVKVVEKEENDDSNQLVEDSIKLSKMLFNKRELLKRYAGLKAELPKVKLGQVSSKGTLVLTFNNKMFLP